ncbi:hypothetical protein ACT453_06980 [Bacillus sp. D-CC]
MGSGPAKRASAGAWLAGATELALVAYQSLGYIPVTGQNSALRSSGAVAIRFRPPADGRSGHRELAAVTNDSSPSPARLDVKGTP